ncbi:MAG: dTDP-4-amino-4,6-dideoxygalactose transaminase [Microscillaceae bacterium]|nr:dTDP-4-amino-4,6-dideoxygalactose transaminase [Microscillaceae bacterium]
MFQIVQVWNTFFAQSMITFNKPYLTGKEVHYIQAAADARKLSGNGRFTRLCQEFFSQKYGFKHCLLTSSCTDALEMIALLLEIQPGDEVIMPSYTFTSCANAFVLRGAKIRFADCLPDHPNLDPLSVEPLVNPQTKAILVMHYAGVACDMEAFVLLCEKYNLYLIEDAAQAVGAFHKDKALGSLGHLAAFSFHETKNISAGEGGMLLINDSNFLERAEILWEKGTNRSAFARGEVSKYTWMDVGSSFLPSEITAAFLWAQLEHIEEIQQKRMDIWQNYYDEFKILEDTGKLKLPNIPSTAQHNAHIFYLLCDNETQRNDLIAHLAKNQIQGIFHYLPLHQSPFYQKTHPIRSYLPHCERFAACLLRLPLYVELSLEDQNQVIRVVKDFFFTNNL